MGVKQSDYPPRLSDDEYALVRLIRRVWPKVLWIARDRTRLTLHSDWPVADQLGLFTARPDTVKLPFRLFPSITIGGRWSVHDLRPDYRPPFLPKVLANCPAPERPDRLYTVDEVAALLLDLVGDPCSCNFNDADEWLPSVCRFQSQCPDPPDRRLDCWREYVRHRGHKLLL